MFLHQAIVWLLNSAIGRLALAKLVKPESLLLCYPATQEHALHYCSRQLQDRYTWTPRILGLARQGRRFMLVLGIGATPSELNEPRFAAELASLVRQMEGMAARMGADDVRYAGILPALLQSRHLVRSGSEAVVTSRVLFRAAADLLRNAWVSVDGILLLGGESPVGRHLRRMLCSVDAINQDAVHCIESEAAMPSQGRYLVVNCASPERFDRLAMKIPSGSIVLNETYPAPRPRIRRLLSERAVALYHLVGVRGRCWPSLPDEHRGAIPCCMAAEDRASEAVVRCLNLAPARLGKTSASNAWLNSVMRTVAL